MGEPGIWSQRNIMMLFGLFPLGGDLASSPDSTLVPVKAVATAASPRRMERYFMMASVFEIGSRMMKWCLLFVKINQALGEHTYRARSASSFPSQRRALGLRHVYVPSSRMTRGGS